MRKKRKAKNNEAFDEGEEIEIVSKTQLKKEMTELQELGKKVASLGNKDFEKIELDDGLRDAMETYRRIKSREGQRRQMQFIGKLMRHIETDNIRTFISDLENGKRQESKAFHALEELRDQLIEKGDDMLPSLKEQHPDLDIQHLRQLIRGAQKEKSNNKAPANSRKLFRYLREIKGI